LRVDLFGERLYDGVVLLALEKEVILHGWAPNHVVGSVENRNELGERIGHSLVSVMMRRSAYVRTKHDDRKPSNAREIPLAVVANLSLDNSV